MLSEAKHLAFSASCEARFFAGVYPEHAEGAQNDIKTQSRAESERTPSLLTLHASRFLLAISSLPAAPL